MLKSIISLILLAGTISANKTVPRGVVQPIDQCGGVGTFIELRVPGCTVPPCELEAGVEVTFETDFIPRSDCSLLGFKLFTLFNDEVFELLDLPIPGSTVVGGSPYTVRYPLTPDAELSGDSFYLMLQIYCTATLQTELCLGCEAVLS